tara:strand:- start:127 stop:435 length:309 start_codon:yes stop_codon:yes gene_type:complete
MNLLFFSTLIGFSIAYLVHYLPHSLEKKNKEKKYTKKLILTWNSKKYHIHHWITFSIIIILLLLGKYVSDSLFFVFIGLALGTIFEDFLFDNIFKIEMKNKN